MEKLHVKYISDFNSKEPISQRRYTLTHSDFTGELFLSIGVKFDEKATSGFYTRIMRDEILAEWVKEGEHYSLHVYCHVSGGIIIGTARWRNAILRREIPFVLKSICQGDKEFLKNYPKLENGSIFIHFQSSNKKYNKIEKWGVIKDFM